MVEKLVTELSFCIECVTTMYDDSKEQNISSPTIEHILSKYYSIIKTLITQLSDFQYAEPLSFHSCLKEYLETVIQILLQSHKFNEECQKVALISIYKVINTIVYNHTAWDEQEGKATGFDPNNMGIINTAAKYKNFQEEVKLCIIQYREFFSESNTYDFLNLLAGKYLQQSSLDLWNDDPEQFIEIEDEHSYIKESQITKESSFNFLSMAV